MELDDVPAPEHVTFEPDMISNQMLRDTVSASKTKSRNNGVFLRGCFSFFSSETRQSPSVLCSLSPPSPSFLCSLSPPPSATQFVGHVCIDRQTTLLQFPFLIKIGVVHIHVYVDIHILDPFLFTAPPNHLIFWKLETPLPSCPFLGGVVWIRRACACTASGCQGCRPGRDV